MTLKSWSQPKTHLHRVSLRLRIEGGGCPPSPLQSTLLSGSSSGPEAPLTPQSHSEPEGTELWLGLQGLSRVWREVGLGDEEVGRPGALLAIEVALPLGSE